MHLAHWVQFDFPMAPLRESCSQLTGVLLPWPFVCTVATLTCTACRLSPKLQLHSHTQAYTQQFSQPTSSLGPAAAALASPSTRPPSSHVAY